MRKELKIMYMCHHPNILKLYSHFEDENNLYLIQELSAGGHLGTKKIYPEHKVLKYTRALIDGLMYMHDNHKIIHRDMKPENIMLGGYNDDTAKIIDFGLSNFKEKWKLRMTKVGTPVYQAPELLKGDGEHDHRVDIWALGCIIFELLTAEYLINADTIPECRKKILNKKFIS